MTLLPENDAMNPCPCCTGLTYAQCCEPFIKGQQIPATVEQLMRSRYSAYSQANVDYIAATMCGPALADFGRQDAQQWAASAKWQKLQVIKAEQPKANAGFVTFIAHYIYQGKAEFIYEISKFIKEGPRWFYHSGKQPKLSLNGPCPCGSGKKYKKCCL